MKTSNRRACQKAFGWLFILGHSLVANPAGAEKPTPQEEALSAQTDPRRAAPETLGTPTEALGLRSDTLHKELGPPSLKISWRKGWNLVALPNAKNARTFSDDVEIWRFEGYETTPPSNVPESERAADPWRLGKWIREPVSGPNPLAKRIGWLHAQRPGSQIFNERTSPVATSSIGPTLDLAGWRLFIAPEGVVAPKSSTQHLWGWFPSLNRYQAVPANTELRPGNAYFVKEAKKRSHTLRQNKTPGTFERPSPASPPGVTARKPKLLITHDGPQTITHLAYLVRGEGGQNDRVYYQRSHRFAAPGPGRWSQEPVILTATGVNTEILEVALAGHRQTVDLAWIERSRQPGSDHPSSRIVLKRHHKGCKALSFCAQTKTVLREGPAYKRDLSMAYDPHGHHHLVWSEGNKVFYMHDLVQEQDQEGELISVFDTKKRELVTDWVKTKIQYEPVHGECPCGDCWCEDIYALADEPDPKNGGLPRTYVERSQDAYVVTPSLHVHDTAVSIIAHQTKLWDASPVPNPAWDKMYEAPVYSDEIVYRLRPTRPVVGWRKTWKTAYEIGDEALWDTLGIQYQYRYHGTWRHENRISVAQRPLRGADSEQPSHLSFGAQPGDENHGLEDAPRWRVTVVDDAFEAQDDHKASYPVLTIAPSGRWVAVYEKGASMNPNKPVGNPIVIRTSDDGGKTWSSPSPPIAHGYRPSVGVTHNPDASEEVVVVYTGPAATNDLTQGRAKTVRVLRSSDLQHFDHTVLSRAHEPDLQRFNPIVLDQARDPRRPTKALQSTGDGEPVLLRVPSLSVHQDLILAAWVEEAPSPHLDDRIVIARASSSTEVHGLSIRPPSATVIKGTDVHVEIHAENRYHMTVKDPPRSTAPALNPATAHDPEPSEAPLAPHPAIAPPAGIIQPIFAIKRAAEHQPTPTTSPRVDVPPPGVTHSPLFGLDLSGGVARASVPAEWLLDPRFDGVTDLAVHVPDVQLVQNQTQANFEMAQTLRKALLKPTATDPSQWVQTEYAPSTPSQTRAPGASEQPSDSAYEDQGNRLDGVVLAGFERAWVYTQGIALARSVREQEHQKAEGMARWLCSPKNTEWAQDKLLGWPFSQNTKNDTWKDARLVTGATAWALHGLGTFLVTDTFLALNHTSQNELRRCYRGALRGLKDHRIAIRLRDRTITSGCSAPEDCAYLMTAGWTTEGLQHAHEPKVLGLRTEDPNEGWFYYDVLDALGYKDFDPSRPPSIRRTQPGTGDPIDDQRFNLTAKAFLALKKRTRAQNVVTEHNLDVLSVLNHSLGHLDQLWPEASPQEREARRIQLKAWRDGVQRGIFELLWDAPAETFTTEKKAPNPCRTEVKTITMKGRVITGGTFSEDGRFVAHPEVAIDNCSWLSLSVNHLNLPPEHRTKLSTCLAYAIDKFADTMPVGDRNQCYYGAHYFPNSFRDPYINPSDHQEVSYHLEATTGLILGLHRFYEAHPAQGRALKTHAEALWAGVQDFVRDHSFMYSSQRIQDLSTRLASSTAAIWYLDTYDALEDRVPDWPAARGFGLDAALATPDPAHAPVLTASLLAPSPDAVAHVGFAIELAKQVGFKEAFKVALVEIMHLGAMTGITTAMNEKDIDALVDQIFIEENHNVVLVDEHVSFTVPTDFEYVGWDAALPPNTGQALYDWPLQAIARAPAEWNDAFAQNIIDGLGGILGSELRRLAVQWLGPIVQDKIPQHIILKKTADGVEIYRKQSLDLWSGHAPRGIVLHLNTNERGPALLHRQPGSWSQWFETHVETDGLSDDHREAYLREVGAWLLDGILAKPNRLSFQERNETIKRKITGEETHIRYIAPNGDPQNLPVPHVLESIAQLEDAGHFAYYGLPFKTYVAGVKNTPEAAYYVSSAPPKAGFAGGIHPDKGNHLLRHLFGHEGGFITLTKDPSLAGGTMPELKEALRKGKGRAWVYTVRPPEGTLDVETVLHHLGLEVSSAHQDRLAAAHDLLYSHVFSAYQVDNQGLPIAGTAQTNEWYEPAIQTPDGHKAGSLIDEHPFTDQDLHSRTLGIRAFSLEKDITVAETNRARLTTPTIVVRSDHQEPDGPEGAFSTGLGPSTGRNDEPGSHTYASTVLHEALGYRASPPPRGSLRSFVYFIANNGRASSLSPINEHAEDGELIFLGAVDPDEIIGAQEYILDPHTGQKTKGTYFANSRYRPKHAGPSLPLEHKGPPIPVARSTMFDPKKLTIQGTDATHTAFYEGTYVGQMELRPDGLLTLDLKEPRGLSTEIVRGAVIAMHDRAKTRTTARGWPIQGLLEQWLKPSKSLSRFRENRAQGTPPARSAEQTDRGEIASLLGYSTALEVRPYGADGIQIAFVQKGTTLKPLDINDLHLTAYSARRELIEGFETYIESKELDSLLGTDHEQLRAAVFGSSLDRSRKELDLRALAQMRAYLSTAGIQIKTTLESELAEVYLQFDDTIAVWPRRQIIDFLAPLVFAGANGAPPFIVQFSDLPSSLHFNDALRTVTKKTLAERSALRGQTQESAGLHHGKILNAEPVVVQVVSTKAPSQLRGGIRPRKEGHYHIEEVAKDDWPQTSFVEATTLPGRVKASAELADKAVWSYTVVIPPKKAFDLFDWAKGNDWEGTKFKKGARILVVGGIPWENIAAWVPLGRQKPAAVVANTDFVSTAYDHNTLNQVDQSLATTILHTGMQPSGNVPHFGDRFAGRALTSDELDTERAYLAYRDAIGRGPPQVRVRGKLETNSAGLKISDIPDMPMAIERQQPWRQGTLQTWSGQFPTKNAFHQDLQTSEITVLEAWKLNPKQGAGIVSSMRYKATYQDGTHAEVVWKETRPAGRRYDIMSADSDKLWAPGVIAGFTDAEIVMNAYGLSWAEKVLYDATALKNEKNRVTEAENRYVKALYEAHRQGEGLGMNPVNGRIKENTTQGTVTGIPDMPITYPENAEWHADRRDWFSKKLLPLTAVHGPLVKIFDTVRSHWLPAAPPALKAGVSLAVDWTGEFEDGSTLTIEWVDPSLDPEAVGLISRWWDEPTPGVTEGQGQHRPLSLPFTRHKKTGHIVVEAEIGAQVLRFLVDNEAPESTLSPEAHQKLHGNAYETVPKIAWARSVNAVFADRVTYVNIHRLSLGGHPFKMLMHVDPEVPYGLDGIIGLDLLHQHIVKVDLNKNELVLYPPNAIETGVLHTQGLKSVPFEMANGHGHFKARLAKGGSAIQALVDLGAASSIMTPEAAEQKEPTKTENAALENTGVSMPMYHYDEVWLGEVVLKPFSVGVTDQPGLRALAKKNRRILLVGLDVLEGRTIVVDYSTNTLYLGSKP